MKWEEKLSENEGPGGGVVLGFRRTKRIGKNCLKYLLEDHNNIQLLVKS